MLGIGGGAMAKVVVVFDFDKTIIDCDSDNWVVEKLDVHDLFAQLLPSLPWNRLMDKMMMELHSRGKTIQDIAECLKKVPLNPRMISAIKSAYASGCDLRIVSDSNYFFIETVLKHNGLMDCFSEINTNPSYVDGEGRLRILQYHDVNKFPSHGCTSCPPNMCKGLVMKRIQASVSAEGEKQFIYVGDGKNDFCPALTLKETDALMPRKNFPLWELICNNKMLVEANIQEWSDWEELESKLHNLTNTIFIEEKCSVRADQLVPVDCKFQTSSISAPDAVNRNVLPVPQ
uniref:Uncharacterized protein n=2 Tax=Populus trichocarpa TaxID=3694 RepID=B9INJ1_POPTR|eukprot:XP_002324759.2 thiamine phosphate phosphatase-like protein [Populus trichocarpa]